VPSNQQRREAAKRKLQRQLVRREEARARRRRTSVIAGTAAVILVAAGVVWLVTASGGDTPTAADGSGTGTDASAETSTSGPSTPCTYTAAGTAAKDVKAPANTSPARTGTVNAQIALNGETVDVVLDRALAPCSVNSFLSLASQGFYTDTSCHRLTKSAGLNVLQCGDPSGKGNGGPGYQYAPQVGASTKYSVGTLAMANTEAGEGSQFFVVYGPTTINPSYSVIGTVSAAGMKVVDAITAKGVKDNAQEGPPVAEAKIGGITVPAEAVTASTVWPSSSAQDTGALPTGRPIGTQAPVSEPPASEAAPVSQTTTN